MRLVAGVSPDGFCLSLALQACGRSLQSRTGESVHAQVVKLGFMSDLFVETALVEMYAKVGDVGTARKVFDLMAKRDLVACNVVLAEYVGCGEIGEAICLFRLHTVMRVSGVSVISI
nr:pentatricopeptide repeat protein AaPPR156 [Agave angustifolia]